MNHTNSHEDLIIAQAAENTTSLLGIIARLDGELTKAERKISELRVAAQAIADDGCAKVKAEIVRICDEDVPF